MVNLIITITWLCATLMSWALCPALWPMWVMALFTNFCYAFVALGDAWLELKGSHS